MKINLIRDLEKISSNFPNLILKIKGYVLEKKNKDFLEIIIYKGFSSSTTHKIDIDADKNILNLKCFFTSYELFEAPLSEINNKFLKETKSFKEISNENFWA
tara:strand:+ start:516 stop:821 length:306 start_codon:yes stop_codon:yes gene_type:complete